MLAEDTTTDSTDRTNADGTASAPPSRLGRLLFGGFLAFMALDNFRNLEQMVGYAESENVPAAEFAVPAASGSLLFGGLGVALWRLPLLAASGVVLFFGAVTPEMHDFWNREGEQRQQQQIHFLKNVALLGAAIAFLVRATRD